jgi:signal transduction histidine kinase
VAIAEAVLPRLRDLMDVPRAIVNLFDLATGEVEWLAAIGRRRLHLEPGLRYSLELAGDVAALRRGTPQLIDVRSLPPSPEADALLASGINVYMVVPMIAGGELIGSVSFGDAAGPFAPELVGIAQEAAAQLAIAIAHARLYERVTRQAEELEQRVQERTRELSAANARLEHEIGARRRVQAEADRANRHKSEFLANMSHELRTPLNGIIGFTQLIHDGKVGPVAPEHKEYLGDVLTSARHLLQLINDVLDLAKVESGRVEFRPEPVDAGAVMHEVRDVVRALADRKRIRLETSLDAALGPLLLDPAKLKQVLYNYVSNAIKFTPEGGQVSVRAVADGADAVRFEVEDTGVGIRAEDLGRLFVDFEQIDLSLPQRHQGTGLGLALTKRLVEAQGGRVGARSTFGQGSVFFAVLPRAATGAPGLPSMGG